MGAESVCSGFAVRQLVRSPLIGQNLYKLSLPPRFSWMYRRHVYTDATKLTPEFINHQAQLTQRAGQICPAAFVQEPQIPATNRDDFSARFRGCQFQ